LLQEYSPWKDQDTLTVFSGHTADDMHVNGQAARVRKTQKQTGSALEDEVKALLFQPAKQFEGIETLFEEGVTYPVTSAFPLYPCPTA